MFCSVTRSSLSWRQFIQFPFIRFIDTLSPVTCSWLKDTQTENRQFHLKHTHKHTLSPASLVQQNLSASDCTALPSSLSPITDAQKKKIKKESTFSLSPWQPLSSFSAQSIRQPSSCPAPSWLKGRSSKTKYHIQSFDLQAVLANFTYSVCVSPIFFLSKSSHLAHIIDRKTFSKNPKQTWKLI